MNCFPCLHRRRIIKEDGSPHAELDDNKHKVGSGSKPERGGQIGPANITSQHFTFLELASATRNFHQECSLGEGGFGKVYKGTLPGTDQVVAVNQLDRHVLQGNKEFMVEVLMLSQLHHDGLVKLVGYCADGDQRLLVYEYMSGGSLEDHLFDIKPDKKPLDWLTRMRIAFGAAQGLEYLHDKAEPPVIYRDLKCSNILMDSDYNPKLSTFGLAKLGPANDNMNVSSRVMGTYGYCAPEYTRDGQLTAKSDVYSIGVLLLELITGRTVFDSTKPLQEQNLITWAQPKFRDPKSFPDIADPLLEHRFPEKGLNQAVAIAAMCLQEEPSVRPLMSDVVMTLSFLMEDPPQSMSAPIPESLPSEERVDTSKNDSDNEDETDIDGHGSGGSDAKVKDGHSKCVHAGVERDEEDDYFPYLVLEDNEYASSDSSSTISFSLGGSMLLRERSSKPRSRSISSNRQVSIAFLEKSISSRNNICGNWSRNSSQMSDVEDHLSSPRDRNFSPSSSRRSDSSHYEIDFTTLKVGKKSPLGRLEFSSGDKGLDNLIHGSNSSSPRSTRSREGTSFGPEEQDRVFGHDVMEES